MQTLAVKATCLILNAKKSIEDALIECNAWYVVLAAVIFVLAFTIVAGLTLWCVIYKGKSFDGEWYWSKKGVKVKAHCR